MGRASLLETSSLVAFVAAALLASLASAAQLKSHRSYRRGSWGYTSSEFESLWLKNVAKWQVDNSTFCNQAIMHQDKAQYWLQTTQALMMTERVQIPRQTRNETVFSKFQRMAQCNGHEYVFESWIEPLAFGLRHPAAPCNMDYLMSKDFLLLTSESELKHIGCGVMPRTFYFDLGASTFADGGGSSQAFFTSAYRTRGITFDRILMWEASTHAVKEIYDGVPPELYGSYQYFNIPASADPKDPTNPLNILKSITNPEDFVLLKLDIDNPPVEDQFIDQIVKDPEIYSRIDELVFEHHCKFPAMERAWGGQPDAKADLAQSYQLFLELRQKGVRSHGWV